MCSDTSAADAMVLSQRVLAKCVELEARVGNLREEMVSLETQIEGVEGQIQALESETDD
ncbi:hypothetical protein HTZ84_05075 [Haloterrigena sp. SYSU A558-1]|uniref:Uncharacterized protein n=1 Tax=Haloterrigena gelatinilytica TaxID=2741724 RepID=A0ABX2LAX4_9EURY|nr:hypothetical protein [Haloterrigena gelatinilytica]NUC71685.1 hypothetical protein [Haloterrigena gelatinilytica]